MADNKTVIEKLYAKEKVYMIPKEKVDGREQVELTIKPLSLDDMGLMNMKEGMEVSELAGNVTKMFSKSLGIPEEDVSKISLEFMEEILMAIMDVNNFKEEDMKKSGIQDFIKKKQELIEAEKKKNGTEQSNKPTQG